MKPNTSLLRILLVILIVFSLSASAIAINIDDDYENSQYENYNETDDSIKEFKSIENEIDDTEGSDIIEVPEQKINLLEQEDLEIKKLEAGETLEFMPEWGTDEQAILNQFKDVRLKNPITVPHSDNLAEMVIPPEEMFDFSGESSKTEQQSSNPEPMGLSNTRGIRADAGNDFAHAEQLTVNGNWTGDFVKSQWNSGNNRWELLDVDFFYINVIEKGNLETEYIEIKFENTVAQVNGSTRILVGFIYDPISLYMHQTTMMLPGEYLGKTIAKSDSDIGITYLDLEILSPQETGTLSAAPPVSGVLFLQIYCLANREINYNITSVKKTVIKPVSPPYDMNNYPDNATIPQSKTSISGSLLQHKDHWDWYDISSYLTYIGDQWPNEISYDIDITRANSAPNSYHTWTSVWLIYDSLDHNTLYMNGDEIDTGGSPTINVGGVPSEPIKSKIERYTSRIWLGLRAYSVGIDNGQMFPQVYDGGCDYTITKFDIVVKNNQPLLTTGKLEPAQNYYYMDDMLTFSVRYRDYDNDAPTYVRVTIDGINYEMTSKGTDYINGVPFTFSIKGSDLDDSFYPHTFNFSTSDGLYLDSMSLSPPKNEFKVIEDQTPGIWNSAPNKISLDEDDDAYVLSCSQIFSDFDPPDGLTYTIYQDNSYGQKYSSPRLDVILIDKTKLKIQLQPNQHGTDQVLIRAQEVLKIGMDTYNFYTSYKLNISVNSVEDIPILNPIGKILGYQDNEIKFQISAVDADVYTDGDILTFITNRSDGKGPDDLKGFKVVPDTLSTTKANITFTPTNEYVGKFLVKITVSDKNGNQDSRDIEFEVANVNDPPIITNIIKEFMKKDVTNTTTVELNTKEDEWFNITILLEDPDVAIGMKNDILIKLENHTFIENIIIQHSESSQLIALLSVLPTNNDVGINYMNISVHDGKGGSDYLSIKVNVENVNDPPDIPTLLKPEENVFSIVDDIMFVGTSDDDDFDIPNSQEELTYKWFIKIDGIFTEIRNNEPFDRIIIDFPTPFLPYNDEDIEPGNYTMKLEVIDSEGESRSIEFVIRLILDYDNDEIPDDWEEKFELDWHNREDAFSDSDKDGYINIKEYQARTSPRDPGDKPADKKAETADYSIYLAIVAIVIVLIILLVIFMIFRSKRKHTEALDDLEHLAYPEEEPSIEEISISKGPSPGIGQSQLSKPSGQMPMATPPPGVSPEVHMQIMKLLQTQPQQQQRQQQPPGMVGSGMGGMGGMGIRTSPATGTTGTTGISPSSTTVPHQGLGTGQGIGDKNQPQFQAGGPSFTPRLPPATQGTGQSSQSSGFDINRRNMNGNGMKCPNCGISVQSGWFLCPACKSPLN